MGTFPEPLSLSLSPSLSLYIGIYAYTYRVILEMSQVYANIYIPRPQKCLSHKAMELAVLFMPFSSHWGWVTHIRLNRLTIIVSDNGLSPSRHQAIIRTSAGILLIGPLGTNFSEILIEICAFSLKKMYLKMSRKWRPFCIGLNVLSTWYHLLPWLSGKHLTLRSQRTFIHWTDLILKVRIAWPWLEVFNVNEMVCNGI